MSNLNIKNYLCLHGEAINIFNFSFLAFLLVALFGIERIYFGMSDREFFAIVALIYYCISGFVTYLYRYASRGIIFSLNSIVCWGFMGFFAFFMTPPDKTLIAFLIFVVSFFFSAKLVYRIRARVSVQINGLDLTMFNISLFAPFFLSLFLLAP